MAKEPTITLPASTAPAETPPAPPPSGNPAVVAATVTGSDPVVTGAPILSPFAAGEEARVSRDSAGQARSGEIVPTTVALDVLGRPILPRATIAAPLPDAPGRADTRVLPSGREVPAHFRKEDAGEERLFTAAARIMRSRKIYDPDAPVPLTRAEFAEKKSSGAVREESFGDGADHPSGT